MKIKQLLMILLFLSACDLFQNPSFDQANNQNLSYNDEFDSLNFPLIKLLIYKESRIRIRYFTKTSQ